jgi:hypothetical protein
MDLFLPFVQRVIYQRGNISLYMWIQVCTVHRTVHLLILYGIRFTGKKPANVSRALDQLWFPGPLLAAGPPVSAGMQLATSSWPCGPPQSFNPMGAMQGFHTTVVTLRQVLTNQRQETTILLPYENHTVFLSSHYPFFYHLHPN